VLNTAHFYPNDPNSQADITAAQRGYGEHLHLSKNAVILCYALAFVMF
jgi:hypothetical protein